MIISVIKKTERKFYFANRRLLPLNDILFFIISTKVVTFKISETTRRPSEHSYDKNKVVQTTNAVLINSKPSTSKENDSNNQDNVLDHISLHYNKDHNDYYFLSSESKDKTSGSKYEPEDNNSQLCAASDVSTNYPAINKNIGKFKLHVTADIDTDVDGEADTLQTVEEFIDPIFLERTQNVKRKIFETTEKTSRKRPKDEENWKRRKAAIAREKGLEYLSQKGRLMPKKQIVEGVLCKKNCRQNCTEKFNLRARENI